MDGCSRLAFQPMEALKVVELLLMGKKHNNSSQAKSP